MGEQKGPKRNRLVRSAGVEPATCPLGGGRSIQMSYERNSLRRDILIFFYSKTKSLK